MTKTELDRNELVATDCIFIITAAGERMGLGKAGEYPIVAMLPLDISEGLTKGARA